jgi:hypothetical protein
MSGAHGWMDCAECGICTEPQSMPVSLPFKAFLAIFMANVVGHLHNTHTHTHPTLFVPMRSDMWRDFRSITIHE